MAGDTIQSGIFGPRADSPSTSLATGSSEERLGFLCFELGGEEYGVDLHFVRQIVKPPPLTWVPRAPDEILGVISIRGMVVTLVDLRLLMGLEPTSWPRSTRVLVVHLDDEPIGLLVDAVTQVLRVRTDALEQSPQLHDGQRAERVLYVARPAGGGQVTVVDLEAILQETMR